jgi:hypothetical protein
MSARAPTAKPIYGLRHAAKELGFATITDMLEAAVVDDCPSVCSECGAVNESGHEPDARLYHCEACGAGGAVSSVLILAGII